MDDSRFVIAGLKQFSARFSRLGLKPFRADLILLAWALSLSVEWFFHSAVTPIVVLGLCVAAACTYWFGRPCRTPLVQERSEPVPRLHATFDGIHNGEVSGWAVDLDHLSQPVHVTIFVNRHPVAHVAAVHYRPDVAEFLQCSGRHGFYVDLADCLPDAPEATLDVRLSNDWPLEHVPAVFQIGSVTKRVAKPTVLFMHIPKTAGTAFREAIAQNFLLSEIAYLYPTPPGFLVSDLRALPLDQRRRFRMIMGHFQFGMDEALPQKSEYITIVREPTARVLSQYAYLRHWQPELVSDASGRLLTLEQVFEARLSTDFDNTLVRCFSGVYERDYPPGTLTEAILDEAVANMRTRFSVIGHQEASSQAFAQLQEQYGWSADHALPSVNLGALYSSEEPGAQLEAAIRHYNRWDFLLYERINEAFPKPRPLTRAAAR